MSHYTPVADRTLYGAEDDLKWAYETSQEHGSVVLQGVSLTLEPMVRFGTLDNVQAYVDRITSMAAVIAAFGKTTRVTVRKRRTGHSAHYQLNTIAIHPERGRWGMNEFTILHELAHHYDRGCGHGPSFAATHIGLLELVVGSQIALALRISYGQHDVPVA